MYLGGVIREYAFYYGGGCFFEDVVGIACKRGLSTILADSFRRVDWYLFIREDIGV